MISIEQLFARFLEQQYRNGTLTPQLAKQFRDWLIDNNYPTSVAHLHEDIFSAVVKVIFGGGKHLTRTELYALFNTTHNDPTTMNGIMNYCCLSWVCPTIDFTSLKGPKEVQRYVRRITKKLTAVLA